jgi:hypothetical protein
MDVNKRFLSPNIVFHFAVDPNLFPFAGTNIDLTHEREPDIPPMQ